MLVKIKPLSINEAWQGRRYKTNKYKAYAKELLLKLPDYDDLPDGRKIVFYEFGVSNLGADWDNFIKNFQDLISTKYGFNDNQIVEGHVRKLKTAKGDEYIAFEIVPEHENDSSFNDWCNSIISTQSRI